TGTAPQPQHDDRPVRRLCRGGPLESQEITHAKRADARQTEPKKGTPRQCARTAILRRGIALHDLSLNTGFTSIAYRATIRAATTSCFFVPLSGVRRSGSLSPSGNRDYWRRCAVSGSAWERIETGHGVVYRFPQSGVGFQLSLFAMLLVAGPLYVGGAAVFFL